MKKTKLIILSGLCLVAVFLCNRNIEAATCTPNSEGICGVITYPTENAAFNVGDVIKIQWYQEGTNAIEITAYDGSSLYTMADIAEIDNPSSNNIQEYQWTVPESLGGRSIYIEGRVCKRGVSCYSIKSKIFLIKDIGFGLLHREVKTCDGPGEQDLDFSKKTSISGKEKTGGSFYFEDFCRNGGNMIKYFCRNGDGIERSYKESSCQYGCINGACKIEDRDVAVVDIKDQPMLKATIKYSAINSRLGDFTWRWIIKENDENGAVLYDDSDWYHNDNDFDALIKPGDTKDLGVNYFLQAGRKYLVKFIFDPTNLMTESNENNNEKVMVFGEDTKKPPLAGQKPDLSIDPGSVAMDYSGMVSIHFDVKNNTDMQISPGGYKLKAEFFADSLQGTKVFTGESSCPGCLGGSFNNSIVIADTLAKAKTVFTDNKKYVARLTVDSDNIVDEANENNNEVVFNFVFGLKNNNDIVDATSVVNEKKEQKKPPTIVDEKKVASTVKEGKGNGKLANKLKGKIFLQVENKGEAWYVDGDSSSKYYLKDGPTAYNALRKFGLGITNANLAKIPIGVESHAIGVDSDNDGIDDKTEVVIGTNPLKNDTDGDGYKDGEEIKNGFDPTTTNKFVQDNQLIDKMDGKILLQVESKGEAWYVYKGKRYYMADGNSAYQIMRFLSVGITNTDLNQIKTGVIN